MAKVMGVYLMPHPPIIIPEIGKGAEKRIQKTIDALEVCCNSILYKKPKTIVLISPHGHVLKDHMLVMTKEKMKGNLARFGASMVSAAYEIDLNLAKEIVNRAVFNKIPCMELNDEIAFNYNISTLLDWGTLVPLYFVSKKYQDFKLIHVTVSMLNYDLLYKFGMAVQEAIESKDNSCDTVIICSGDLSHVLADNGPYGFNPQGPVLDSKIIELLEACDVNGLLGLDKNLIEEGKECGLRSLIIGLGTLEGYSFTSKILSYEAPFGVGYAVACLEPIAKISDGKLSGKFLTENRINMDNFAVINDPYVKLARKSLKHYLQSGKILKVEHKEIPSEMLTRRAGVFVSIKKGGKLRGCIGTINPLRKNVAEEIIYNAVSAGTEDSRFAPIIVNEWDELVFSVDILKEPYPVKSVADINVKKHGVIVKSGRRTGLLLPDIEGIDTPQEQIEIALEKAGIKTKELYTLECFEVERHK